ncbi:unnamed protein product [Allacma fusca]|uniref:Gustatory receptor n=1 Tax=Allacma fusca TaxID=39272 RepID=A0A8J2KFN0_9HEXA|nr:unnamed protein product [Allacma fusca]
MCIIIPLQMVVMYYVDDADFIIQCDIASEFYRQIEMVLVETQEHLMGNDRSIRLEDAQKWHQLLKRNRMIVGQIGSITKIPQLLSLLEVTGNLTVFLYSIFNLATSLNSPENAFLKTTAGYTFVGLIRLHFKTRKAEQVTDAEGRVHDALFALNEFPQALEVQLELQGMRNTITATPARIAFGNYVVLHKGVLLSIFNQVVTYLIVLLQFDKSNS